METMIPESSVLGEFTHDRISPDRYGLMLRKPELEQQSSSTRSNNIPDPIPMPIKV